MPEILFTSSPAALLACDIDFCQNICARGNPGRVSSNLYTEIPLAPFHTREVVENEACTASDIECCVDALVRAIEYI